ncbi:hypothetical protein [Gracilimonas sp.]|uniref:hypothetical protein n=1 Tax=Gracilimonas sp. TaxID=1974203 RepID=UPI003D0DA4B2
MADQNKKPPRAFSWVFMGTGVGIVLISFEVILVDDSSVNAPLWVIGICGLIFFLTGVLIYLGEKSRYNNLLAAIMVAAMGTVGSWVALFGADSGFSGGIPLLSADFNLSLARLLFGFGGFLCFLIAGYALKQQFTRKENSK